LADSLEKAIRAPEIRSALGRGDLCLVTPYSPAGATETLKAGWVPVFVLEHPAMPEGNRVLLQRGGVL